MKSVSFHRSTSCLFLGLVTLISCNHQALKLTILNRKILKDIPSASGISMIDEDIYVIGDNSPWIYRLNNKYQIADRFVIFPGITDSIIPKNSKPDFEAMTAVQLGNEKELLVFGSGSKSPERDILVRVSFDSSFQAKHYPLNHFYNGIKSTTELDDMTLNIEAAASSGDELFLFNREKNILLQFNLNNFIRYLEEKSGFPAQKEYVITLPVFNNIQAKFSGASAVPHENKIIFTASLENNLNPIDDGEIVGSYVGIINIEELKNNYQPECILISEKNENLTIKVESVEVLRIGNTGKLTILLVTDSDGGASEIIKGRLKRK